VSSQNPTGATVSVVATTTILGDVAGQVMSCAGGQVRTLMPIGADPHAYSPSSADVAAMVSADLVIANGLGLEETLSSALATARQDGADVLEVGPALDPQPFGDSSSQDPHVWMDVSRTATAATVIGDKLAAVTGDTAYADCGGKVAASLTATDTEVRTILHEVPQASRILVTDHDAFGYFSRAYGFTVAGAVIPGGSTLAQPSSSELTALSQKIRETGVRAIFANTANPTALIDALAQESGTHVAVVQLYVGSLGAAGSGADTYQGMMLTDAHRIADGLKG
jgi:zinc/manganese transport system substrate-binding protein